MITANEMHKIATGQNDVIDESFLINVQELIKTKAFHGGMEIEIPLRKVNMVTMYELKKQLDDGGFEYIIKPKQIIHIKW